MLGLRKGFGKRRSRHAAGRHRQRLVVERLEDRTLRDTARWINPAGGDWNMAGKEDIGRLLEGDRRPGGSAATALVRDRVRNSVEEEAAGEQA